MNNKLISRIVYPIDYKGYVDGNIVLNLQGYIMQLYRGDCNDFMNKYRSAFESIEIDDTLNEIIVKDKSLTENLPFKVSKYFDNDKGFLTIPPVGTERRSNFFSEVMETRNLFISIVSERIKKICNCNTYSTMGITVIDLYNGDTSVGDLYIDPFMGDISVDEL